jgi:prepilin-type N-terminal cleavage/methylation domain-containing protein
MIKKNQAGFSLIEILISITLLSFVMMAVISVTEDSTTTKERVSREDRESLQIETAMSKLQYDFNHIYTPLFFDVKMLFDEDAEEFNQLVQSRYQENDRFDYPDYHSRPVPRFSSPEKYTFEFLSLSNRRKYQDQKQSRFNWVRYTIDDIDDPNEAGRNIKALVRYASGVNPYGIERLDVSRLKPQVLLENVEKVIFYYWDKQKQKWQDSLEYVQDGENKIRGLKVEVYWKNSQGLELQTTRIFRALFPDFEPEDPYAILKKKIQAAQNANATNTGTTTNNTDEGEDNE